MPARVLTAILLLLSMPAFAQTAAKSRYLARHAADPVQWQPWSEATFAKAQKSGKPLFLSIGYASCHWCHVMERESFRDAEIARLLNDHFVPVLVDREEHPEVDAAYLVFVQKIIGTAGWPANLILTPDREPVAGATYVPRDTLRQLLGAFANRWPADRETLLADGRRILNAARAARIPGADVKPEVLDAVYSRIAATYDANRGGFSIAPKFPQAMTISFLLRYAERTKNEQARAMALHTLRAMANGSIHDQLGGGFHRYTVDADWRTPHFEKMLPDQALLAIAYLEAWQLTGDESFAAVARDTLDYALVDLRAPAGGAFWSSQDSDSLIPGRAKEELVEGAFYFWRHDELEPLLGRDDATLMARYLGIKEQGEMSGLNLPYVADPPLAREQPERIAKARARLNEIRSKRPSPFRDDKVLAGWNGLMISALARAGAALGEPKYANAAAFAARDVTAKLWNGKTKALRRRWVGGQAGIDALPEDYALLAQGLLDLFESSSDVRWLELAIALQTRQDELFWNASTGRYEGGKTVPEAVRGLAADRDSAVPSANSIAASNLLRLASLGGNAAWRERANIILQAHAGRLAAEGTELTQLASAVEQSLAPPVQVVVAGSLRFEDTQLLLRAANRRFLPNRLVVAVSGGPAQQRLAAYMPHVKELGMVDKKAAAYVCEGTACKPPVTDAAQLEKLLPK
jgi:uncharacterized protein YyaL (SSP411 family)